MADPARPEVPARRRGERSRTLKVLGISPLDKDATVSLVENGTVLFAAAEERFSRKKQHAGFPKRALESALAYTGTDPAEIEAVAYPFYAWSREVELIKKAFEQERNFRSSFNNAGLDGSLAEAFGKVPERDGSIHGLVRANARIEKGAFKELFYRFAGVHPVFSRHAARRGSNGWARAAARAHRRWHTELERHLSQFGLLGKLRRFEHHLSHARNAYHASGLDRALIVTLDGYGSGLAGSISLGEGGKIKRLHDISYPFSLGTYYETVTSSLGFNPSRHAGKVVGLAAYGDPEVLSQVLLSRFDLSTPGTYRMLDNLNIYFSRHLAASFPMVDVAAAYQHVLETVVAGVVEHWVGETGCGNVVLSGGVAANVKMNQRIFEVMGVERVFVYPNMGDGGCGTGIAWHLNWPGGVGEPIRDVYLGPSYSERAIVRALDDAGLAYSSPDHLASEVAQRLNRGEVIARFAGRMEYGPRALGNRSILYHAREPDVNQWLNHRLGRTEFMPFAPVTLWEARAQCYENIHGAEHAAEFMTITFDCTDWMKENCPAAVHVDGTARPQLVRREINSEYYDIIDEYKKIAGIPCLINTSFNMHEEPIVCTPDDAVRAFLRGNLDGLAIGPFLVSNPNLQDREHPSA